LGTSEDNGKGKREPNRTFAMNTKHKSPKTTVNTPDRYAGLIRQLNKHIVAFNTFLSGKCQLKKIDPSDPETYSDNIQERYPASQDIAGVYVLCGQSEQDPTRLCAYVGKASCQHKIGHRLWAHLNASRLKNKTSSIYKFGQRPDSFIIEVILAIPTPIPPSMAPALEEYIITAGLTGIHLLNKNGRSHACLNKRVL